MATVIRSATAVAAATCACIVLVVEFATTPPVGSESAIFARVVSESAAALRAGCGRVFNERGDNGLRDAGDSTFAAIMVDFAFFMATWALSQARVDGPLSVLDPALAMIFVVA